MSTVDSTFVRRTGTTGAGVVWLDDPGAGDVTLAGAKAANLAAARRAGLLTLGGFVVTTSCTPTLATGVAPGLYAAWVELAAGGERPLAVRSSSVLEDGLTASMAGRFTSVLDVWGWTAFLEAARAVVGSGRAAGDAPMAVLAQPMLHARLGGVLFGLDPVSGRRDRLVVAAVHGGPDRLVSGLVAGAHYELTRRGRIRTSAHADPPLPVRLRRQLARLSARVEAAFGGPQDIEWATDRHGRLVLLQARPVTAHGQAAAAAGPVLGPGPVAETLPGVLAELEQDLWAEPLRAGLVEALSLAGVASSRRLRASPVVAVVSGQLAADLDLLGVRRGHRTLVARLDPRPPARRLASSWRVGRLRAAVPVLAEGLIADVDRLLLDVPRLEDLHHAELLGVLLRSRQLLVALHGQEVLAGLLLGSPHGAVTGAGAAITAVALGRQAGASDEEIIAEHPVVLALVPPRIGKRVTLPSAVASTDDASTDDASTDGVADTTAVLREALRLRARWVQELTARAAGRLGALLAADGRLDGRGLVRHLRMAELAAVVEGQPPPPDLHARFRPEPVPLPAMFRLAPDGSPVAVHSDRPGRGAGGGRSVGVVVHGAGAPPPDGAILVVRTLDPSLAPHLCRLGGLVAETGSVLSHLAILARESGVPTVVGVDRAADRLPAGSMAFVDGSTGDVGLVDAGVLDLREAR